MPKFIITILFILLLLCASITYLVLKIPPTSTFVVIGFFVLLWITLGIILSLPTSYLLGRNRERLKDKRDLKCLYRNCLRRGLMISLIFVSYFLLKYLNIFSSQTFFLVFASATIFEIWKSLKQI
ncbi:MAG: hypothetical protein ABIJ38_01505 [Patescibacteria group bacterium]